MSNYVTANPYVAVMQSLKNLTPFICPIDAGQRDTSVAVAHSHRFTVVGRLHAHASPVLLICNVTLTDEITCSLQCDGTV